VLSFLDEDHLFGSSLFCIGYQVEEGAFSESVNSNIAKHDIEVESVRVEETGETPVAVWSIQSYSGI